MLDILVPATRYYSSSSQADCPSSLPFYYHFHTPIDSSNMFSAFSIKYKCGTMISNTPVSEANLTICYMNMFSHKHQYHYNITHTHARTHTHSCGSPVLPIGCQRLRFSVALQVLHNIQYSGNPYSGGLHLLLPSFRPKHPLPHLHASVKWREIVHTVTQTGCVWCVVVLYSWSSVQLLHWSLLHPHSPESLFLHLHAVLSSQPVLPHDRRLQAQTSCSPYSSICSSYAHLSSKTESLVSLKLNFCAHVPCGGCSISQWGCHECIAHTREMVPGKTRLHFQWTHFDACDCNDRHYGCPPGICPRHDLAERNRSMYRKCYVICCFGRNIVGKCVRCETLPRIIVKFVMVKDVTCNCFNVCSIHLVLFFLFLNCIYIIFIFIQISFSNLSVIMNFIHKHIYCMSIFHMVLIFKNFLN